MTKILFDYNDESGTCCTVTGAAAGTLCITRTRGEHTLENIQLDAYQAALLIPELERFIAQRSSHRVGDLTWRVADGTLYINDVPVLVLCFGFQPDKEETFNLVSKLLTRGAAVHLFNILRDERKTDIQLEQWIQTRLDTFNEACEF